MRHDALKRRRVEVLDVNYNDKVQREADMKPSVNVASSAEGGEMDDVDSGRFCFYCFRRVEEDSVLDLASSSNRKLDIHSFSRLIESLNEDKASSHLVNQDVELFFAFLLGMIMYPNYAISNKTYRFVFQEH